MAKVVKKSKKKVGPMKLGKDYIIREGDIFFSEFWGWNLFEEEGATILGGSLGDLKEMFCEVRDGLIFESARLQIDKVGTKRTVLREWEYCGNIYDF